MRQRNSALSRIGDRLGQRPGQYGDTGCRSRRERSSVARRWSWGGLLRRCRRTRVAGLPGEGIHHALRQLVERICARPLSVCEKLHMIDTQDLAAAASSSPWQSPRVWAGPAECGEAPRRVKHNPRSQCSCAVKSPNTASEPEGLVVRIKHRGTSGAQGDGCSCSSIHRPEDPCAADSRCILAVVYRAMELYSGDDWKWLDSPIVRRRCWTRCSAGKALANGRRLQILTCSLKVSAQ